MNVLINTGVQKRIVFRLANELFAVKIEKVKEIIKPTAITRVPKTPNYLEGVINLRGKIVPVLNLRKRFNMSEQDNKQKRFLIIGYKKALVGIVVDEVSEVIEFSEEEIISPPLISRTFNSEYLEGIIRRDNEIIVLLSIDNLLDDEIVRIKNDSPRKD